MKARSLACLALGLVLAVLGTDRGGTALLAALAGAAALFLRFWVQPRWFCQPAPAVRHALNMAVVALLWVATLVLFLTHWLPVGAFLALALCALVWNFLDKPEGRVPDFILTCLVAVAGVGVFAFTDLPLSLAMGAAMIMGVLVLAGFAVLDRERIAETMGPQVTRRSIRIDLLPICAAALFLLPVALEAPDLKVGGAPGAPWTAPLERLSGFATRVDLRLLGELKTNDQRALRVAVHQELPRPAQWSGDEEESPDRPPLLLRGTSLGRYRDGMFVPLDPPDRYASSFVEEESSRIGFIQVLQEVALAPHGGRELFAMPRAIGGSEECEQVGGDVRAREPVDAPLFYTVRSRVLPPSQRKFLDLYAARHPDERYLAVPDSWPPAADDLARAVLAAARGRTDYRRVAALESWFKWSGGFSYTRFNRNDGPDPIASFLFETRAGHCEFFAVSMTLLLRSRGIPARVAVGYRGGTWNDRLKVFEVLQKNAHAWVEVPFEGVGWVSFDPTPPETRLDLPSAAAGGGAGADEGGAAGAATTTSVVADEPLERRIPFWAWVGGAMLVFAGFRLLRRTRTRVSRRFASDPAADLRARLVAGLRRAGAPRSDAMTLMELLDHARGLPASLLPQVRRVVALVYRSRFGFQAATPDELDAAARVLLQVERSEAASRRS